MLSLTREELLDLYWNRNLSTYKIAKKYGVHHHAIQYWMNKFSIPQRAKVKKPNLKMSLDIAYILGVLLGDGYVSAYHVRLNTSEKVFAESFAMALRNIRLNPSIKLYLRHEKREGWKETNYFCTCGCSKMFCDWLRTLSLSEIEKKVSSKKEYIIAFIRGFYESEGCIGYATKNEQKYLRLLIFNTNKKLLEMVRRLCNDLGYHFGLWEKRVYHPKRKRQYVLGKYGKRAFLFLKQINPCVKRGIVL